MKTERHIPEIVLVTGAAGFIGLHLTRALLDRGSRVIALDNYRTGSRSALAGLVAGYPTAQSLVIEHDITEPLPGGMICDKIVNLACPASPKHYALDPLDTLWASVLGTVHLLDLARDLGGVPLLQASTSEVYGDPVLSPQSEDLPGLVDTMNERACYFEGKRTAEVLCDLYRQIRSQGVSTRIARIFNSYGPGMLPDDGRVVSSFACQALAGQPLTVYGTGSQTRSLCHVSDTVRGLLAMVDYEGEIDYPVNIGNPDEITIKDLALEISALVAPGREPMIQYGPLPNGEPTRRRPDIARAVSILGWKPAIPRRAGLAQTVEWFRALRAEPMPVPTLTVVGE